MARAYGAAHPLLVHGDMIAARKAFLEVYARELQEARLAGRPVEWSVTVGTDPYGREEPILDAIERHRLSPAYARQFLPPSEEVEQRIAKVIREMAEKKAIAGPAKAIAGAPQDRDSEDVAVATQTRGGEQ